MAALKYPKLIFSTSVENFLWRLFYTIIGSFFFTPTSCEFFFFIGILQKSFFPCIQDLAKKSLFLNIGILRKSFFSTLGTYENSVSSFLAVKLRYDAIPEKIVLFVSS